VSALSFQHLSKVKINHFPEKEFSVVEMTDDRGLAVKIFLEGKSHEMHARNIGGALNAAVPVAVPA
jgi:hypothetical protein